MKAKADFLELPNRLKTLAVDQTPKWGIMTPQHMVEHIIGTWRISNGRARVAPAASGDELDRRRAFIFSDVAYQKNITNPVFGDGLMKLRKPNLQAAIDHLEDEMTAFFEYHESNPEAMEAHPVFGILDYNGWIVFQSKHMGHHLAQFEIDF
ncbi:hypothetical protein OAA53_00080 [Salibacteraceae bacterium]|nr:DUF1569 domain-containing protein [Flavobacteriales bacterium]MDB9701106.1 hypothetical protein [Salibacteraceae bacterium]